MINEFLNEPKLRNIIKRGLVKIKYRLGGYATIYSMKEDLKRYEIKNVIN